MIVLLIRYCIFASAINPPTEPCRCRFRFRSGAGDVALANAKQTQNKTKNSID